ncbi:MAG: Na(+)-translocating NADH-quinone reductase subunit A [Candidatus Hydrogenedentes bacterium]|nr:Na(+)-translocating NADH-quinone reductase subunit A [Candidatus Hydrogenedentota bacterium]
MAVHTIKKGLDLPIAGAPVQQIDGLRIPSRVGLLADDSIGLRPTMLVQAGDRVMRGQPLFEDKKNPGVICTSPAAGTVGSINRGEKRAFQSIVIDLDEAERKGEGEQVAFSTYTGTSPAGLSRDEITALLVESGLWTTLRTRPFSKVPVPGSTPMAIFVTAMDTNPHALNPEIAIKGNEAHFERGLICIAKLTEGRTYLCKARGAAIPANPNTGIQIEEFAGVHPAGTVGVHINRLHPVSAKKVAWHINYQDVVAVGKLFGTGQLDVERVISLAGPSMKSPRLVRTRVGASTDDLVRGELVDGEHRVIGGSVLAGRTAMGDIFGYLGRYHTQVSALREGREREFLGWLSPGMKKFSVIRVFASKLFNGKTFDFSTSTNGSPRAMVPIGMYEKVMPMDIQPTFLLRSLLTGDVEEAEKLGLLELDEEDLALCTFVCPGKHDYGVRLRAMLNQIDKEG